ncbi:MAG: hypothetical protein DRR16_24375 [Candidatus Parabeggiatoa sp. nov. 3]|nr:MAG: hypothetical protein DRR00_11740 [Gammaproteobacteria bacterium]RKZ66904.1 MAG: hypothetical protein DRQ99_08210 [Gammaproteobacteria bacterium]RKZ80152.1 MAG: hypothetical protein DRR16_24375 [Gammaproteobacteria bacterium]
MKSNPHCEQLQKTFDCCEECFEISTAASENKKRFSIETKNRFNYCRIKVDACLISDDTHIKCDYAFLKCDILGAGINLTFGNPRLPPGAIHIQPLQGCARFFVLLFLVVFQAQLTKDL